MYKINMLSIGRIKDDWLKAAVGDYTRRLRGKLSIQWHFVKNLIQLEELLEKNRPYVALDLSGKHFSSEEFSVWLIEELASSGCRLNIAIGGAEGLSPSIRENASSLISLSPLTFTHQLAYLITMEQIYRAIEISKGSPYHR